MNVQLLDGKQLLPASQEEQTAGIRGGGSVIIYPEKPLAPPREAQLGTPVSFGGIFDLIAISVDRAEDGLSLTLWWQSQAKTDQAYTIFVHLLDEQGQVVAQAGSY